MSIEEIYYVSDPNDSNAKPTIVIPGTYFCYNYPKCKGIQKIYYTDDELKPCPLCGGLTFFSV